MSLLINAVRRVDRRPAILCRAVRPRTGSRAYAGTPTGVHMQGRRYHELWERMYHGSRV